jgi:peptidoglycan/LPS O-acetylase OafA/YrhL
MTGWPSDGRRVGELAESRTGNNFDFLRIVLASLVILDHSLKFVGCSGAEPFTVATHGQMNGGQVAVNAFFILSGFLICQSWLRSASWRHYLSRRVLRIYPGFLVAAALSAMIAAPLLEPDPAAYWRALRWPAFLRGLLDLRLRIPETTVVNGSLWTIRFEFLCYFGVLLLGLTGLLARRAWVLGALVIATGTLAAQEVFGVKIPAGHYSWLIGWYDCWPRFATNFLAGTVFFLYRDRIVLSAHRFWAAAAGLTLLSIQPWSRALPVAFPWLGGYLLLHVAYLERPWMHDWARRRDLSYGMYLYAYPIQMLLARWIGPLLEPGWTTITPLLIFLAAMPLAAACAVASWSLVEAPAMRLRRPFAAWLDRRLGAAMARAVFPGVTLAQRPPSPRQAPRPLPANPLAVERARP